MERDGLNLNKLRDKNPFRVPDGYFEGFTDKMMNRLPEKEMLQPKKISMYDRVKPWLYLAAVFVGFIILFNVFNKVNVKQTEEKAKFVQTTKQNAQSVSTETIDEDAEFLEYIEEMYADKYATTYYMDGF